jgi:hypothetical protein
MNPDANFELPAPVAAHPRKTLIKNTPTKKGAPKRKAPTTLASHRKPRERKQPTRYGFYPDLPKPKRTIAKKH